MSKSQEDFITYNQSFLENVRGKLSARFHLDADRAPEYEPYPDDRRLRVYTIDLFLKSPKRDQIRRVSYVMDDPTYVDPKGSSIDVDNDFQEEITSYGDVEVEVIVDLSGHKYRQRAWLSQMLENGHANDMTRSVRTAIERIKVN